MAMSSSTEAGGSGPKNLRPSLDVKLLADWRYVERQKAFTSFSGSSFSPERELPKGTIVRPMVPELAKADPAKLSADEADLARFVQIIFPKGTSTGRYLAEIRKWPCVEEDPKQTPEASLP